VADVAEASARARQEEDQYRAELRKMMSTALPLQLVRSQWHDALAEALQQEDALVAWESFRDEQQPRCSSSSTIPFSVPSGSVRFAIFRTPAESLERPSAKPGKVFTFPEPERLR
jgi:hypothetical protein